MMRTGRLGLPWPLSSMALNSMASDIICNSGYNSNYMNSDIQEIDTGFQISVALPGIKKDQVEVSLEENKLVVEVKQEEQKEEQDNASDSTNPFMELNQRYNVRQGRRVFGIGSGIDMQNIQAQMEDGMLRITLLKKEPEQQKRLITLN